MNFLGVGPLELLFILLLILIIFGPKEVEKAGKTLGKSLNKFVRSDTWKTLNRTSQEIKALPDRLMREAGLEDLEKTAKEELHQVEHIIRQSINDDSANNSPHGATEESSGPAKVIPTNSSEQARKE